MEPTPTRPSEKALVGVDVFLDWSKEVRDPDMLGRNLETTAPQGWKLKMITDRGVKVYPGGLPETFHTDHWRCRFLPAAGDATTFDQVLDLMRALHEAGQDGIKTEHLYTFGGERADSLGQGD